MVLNIFEEQVVFFQRHTFQKFPVNLITNLSMAQPLDLIWILEHSKGTAQLLNRNF